MTTERDPRTRIVLSWLREETHENAERVLLRALDEVDTTPQRRSWWPARRTERMNSYAKLIATAAAVLVVAIAGYQLLPGRSGPGVSNPTPTVPGAPSVASPTAPAVGLTANGVIALAKDGDIVVADRPGGDLRPLVTGPEDERSPMFSPDGTRLAFLRGDALMVADADGTNVVQLTPETLGSSRWSFAPDGRSLVGSAGIDGQERVVVRPVDPAAALTVLDIPFLASSQEVFETGGPSFRPTNPQEILVVTRLEPGGPRGIYVYDLATGAIRTIVEPAGYVFDVAWLPDGEHITYSLTGVESSGSRIVAADGSGDHAFDALRGQFSPFSNDGSRFVAERGGEGVAEGRPSIVSINATEEPVVLACGAGTDIECPEPLTYWTWSPDDSMLIATVVGETSSSGEGQTYLLVDASTGQVTELDWVNAGTPAWQRVAP